MITTTINAFPHRARARDGCRERNAAREIRFLSRLKVALFFGSTWDRDLPWAPDDSQDVAPS